MNFNTGKRPITDTMCSNMQIQSNKMALTGEIRAAK